MGVILDCVYFQKVSLFLKSTEPRKPTALTANQSNAFSLLRGTKRINQSQPMRLKLVQFWVCTKCLQSLSQALANCYPSSSTWSPPLIRMMPWMKAKCWYDSIFCPLFSSCSRQKRRILWNIGRSLASSGSTWKCLCSCDRPDSSPQLQKNSPFMAFVTTIVWVKSSCVRGDSCGWKSLLTTNTCFLYTLNLLKRRAWVRPNSIISSPSSQGQMKGSRSWLLWDYSLRYSFVVSTQFISTPSFSCTTSISFVRGQRAECFRWQARSIISLRVYIFIWLDFNLENSRRMSNRETRLTHPPTTMSLSMYSRVSTKCFAFNNPISIQNCLFIIVKYKSMAPKVAPKLTKKQLDELKKEEARKREAQERQRKEEEEERMRERMRLDAIESEKRMEEERIRIMSQKELYRDTLLKHMKQQEKQINRLQQEQSWVKNTTEYLTIFDTSSPKISTFLSVFRDEPFTTPEKVLKDCEEAETYITYIMHKMLRARAENNTQEEVSCKHIIETIRKMEIEKIQQIMIRMANSAEEMEEKNSELSKKGEPSRKADGQKIAQYQQYHTTNIKIGMFLNSSTTKNLNKFRPIQIKQFGLNTEIPSKWMNANTIVRFQWVNYNPYSPQQWLKFDIIGGVYNLQFYELLLGSRRMNNVVLKKHYKGAEILDKFKLSTALIKEPFNVMYQIPQYVFLSSPALSFAQYDLAQGHWVLLPPDTVTEFDSRLKRAICRITRPQPIAYVQSRCTDYPYVAWQLRSLQPNRALLDIEVRRAHNEGFFMLCFQIMDHSVRLVLNEKYPELVDLCEVARPPQQLLLELARRGINLLPQDEDYQEANLPRKDAAAESAAIRDIAYAVQSFYIRSEVNESSEIVVKIRENPQYQSVFLEDQEKDWKKIRWSGSDRCWVINRAIIDRHLNLQVLLSNHDICDRECVERMKFDNHYLFKRNLMKLLSLTRVLSFTTNKEQKTTLRWVLRQRVLIQ